MKTVDIADEIFRELDAPDDFPIPNISFWLTSNIGKLNTLLCLDITVDANMEFVPELTDPQKDILKLLYYVYVYRRLNRNALGAGAYDWSEIQEGDTSIRRVSKNELAKSYKALKDDIQKELDDLVFFYKQRQSLPAAYHYRTPYELIEHLRYLLV